MNTATYNEIFCHHEIFGSSHILFLVKRLKHLSWIAGFNEASELSKPSMVWRPSLYGTSYFDDSHIDAFRTTQT